MSPLGCNGTNPTLSRRWYNDHVDSAERSVDGDGSACESRGCGMDNRFVSVWSMRPALAVVLSFYWGGCGTSPGGGGNVTLTLDIPNAALDPKGYSFVDVVLHLPSG